MRLERGSVRLEWMRLVINTLSEQLATIGAATPVEVSFERQCVDDSLCGQGACDTGYGPSVGSVFCVPAEELHGLPKRLMRVSVRTKCVRFIPQNRQSRYCAVKIAGMNS